MAKPKEAQEKILLELVSTYAETEYGAKYGAKNVRSMTDFQRSFPISNYQSLLPWLELVKQGRPDALLSEPVENWVMTRGTTGIPKIIPTIRRHLDLILMAGARGLINFALRRKDFEVLSGRCSISIFPAMWAF